mmetsp:Transcript_22800/g.61829  ORF Transcript_22800/g.61829 Transcript_22800/m.61829 type:complete len:201 (-) Transcript_22800:2075-2677(-)
MTLEIACKSARSANVLRRRQNFSASKPKKRRSARLNASALPRPSMPRWIWTGINPSLALSLRRSCCRSSQSRASSSSETWRRPSLSSSLRWRILTRTATCHLRNFPNSTSSSWRILKPRSFASSWRRRTSGSLPRARPRRASMTTGTWRPSSVSSACSLTHLSPRPRARGSTLSWMRTACAQRLPHPCPMNAHRVVWCST